MSSSSQLTTSSTPTSIQGLFIPLTTLFIPSSSCSGGKWSGAAFISGLTEVYRQPRNDGDFNAYLADCYPTGVADSQLTYSPGICPSGFTTAYSAVIENSITSAQCCPQGFGRWRDEFASISVPAETKTQSCFRTYTTSASIDCSFSGPDSQCVAATVGPGVAESFAVYVLYENKDLSLFPKDYTPDGASIGVITQTPELQSTAITTIPFPSSASAGSGPSNSAASPTSPSLQLTETPKSSTVLSAGMKAGIAVGVIIGVCGLLGLGTLFLWRRKRQRKAQNHDVPNTDLPEFVAVTKSKPHMAEPRMSSDLKPTYAYHHVGVLGELDGSNHSPSLQELPAIPRLSYSQQDLSGTPERPPITSQTSTREPKKPQPQKQSSVLPKETKFEHRPEPGPAVNNQDISKNTIDDPETTLKSSVAPVSRAASPSTSSTRLQSEVPPFALPKPKEEMTAADWELLYLESEERRLRERRETLLRSHDM